MAAPDADVVFMIVLPDAGAVIGVARARRIHNGLVHRFADKLRRGIRVGALNSLLPGSVIFAAIEQVGYLAAGEFLGGFARNIRSAAASDGLAGKDIAVKIALLNGAARVVSAHAANIAAAADHAGAVAALNGAAITAAAAVGVRAANAAGSFAAHCRTAAAVLNGTAIAAGTTHAAGILSANKVGIHYCYVSDACATEKDPKQSSVFRIRAVQTGDGMVLTVKGTCISMIWG